MEEGSFALKPSKPRIVTNESIANDGRQVPAALDLPLNQIFLGYKYVPFDPKKVVKKDAENGDAVCRLASCFRSNVDCLTIHTTLQAPQPSFSGGGATLSGRPATDASQPADSATEASTEAPKPDHWASLGGGSKLSTGRKDRIGGSVAAPIEVMDEDNDSGSEFNGFDEDDDAIVIDSD
jgi:ubiquitin fusion degradation protein 1